MTKLISFSLFTFLFLSCNSNKPESDPVIARFREKELHISDLNGLLPSQGTKQDSNFVIQNYSDKWIKNQVVLEKALESKELNLNEINKKTQEYKNALIIYEFKKNLLNGKLDTLISEEEYQKFYSLHEKDFELRQNIVKGFVIKVKGKSFGLLGINKELNRLKECNASSKFVKSYINKFAVSHSIETENWLTFDALVKSSPFSKIQNKTDWLSKSNWGIMEENGFSYYLKICECKLENRISPIDYVKEQIKSIILNSRKVKLLEEYEEEIYKKALSEKQIEKYN